MVTNVNKKKNVIKMMIYNALIQDPDKFVYKYDLKNYLSDVKTSSLDRTLQILQKKGLIERAGPIKFNSKYRIKERNRDIWLYSDKKE